jgi:hypothetical protein
MENKIIEELIQSTNQLLEKIYDFNDSMLRSNASKGKRFLVSTMGELLVLKQLLIYYKKPLCSSESNTLIYHGNTNKGFDIELILGGKSTKIEVKSSDISLQHNSKIWGGNFFKWPHMNENHGNSSESNLFFCFISVSNKDNPRFWIIPSKGVQEYILWEHKFWIDQTMGKGNKDGKMRTLRIYEGVVDEDKEILRLKSKDYENNWGDLGPI